MALAPVALSNAAALQIDQLGVVAIIPGTMMFVQTGTMLDEAGDQIPLPEPWIYFAEPGTPGDPNAVPPVPDGPPRLHGHPWRAVLGVMLTTPPTPE